MSSSRRSRRRRDEEAETERSAERGIDEMADSVHARRHGEDESEDASARSSRTRSKSKSRRSKSRQRASSTSSRRSRRRDEAGAEDDREDAKIEDALVLENLELEDSRKKRYQDGTINNKPESRRIQPLQLGQLVQIMPMALLFLRDAFGAGAGDLFLESAEAEDDRRAQHMLVDLMDTLNIAGDLSMSQYREFFGEHTPQSIAGGVRLIMLKCEPPFVPRDVGEDLVAVLGSLDSCATGEDCARVIGPILDQLPRQHFMALAELCAFLRDTATDTAELACLIGPALFSYGSTNISEDHAAASAAAIMDLLIEECEAFFGRMCAVSSLTGLGERNYIVSPSHAMLSRKSARKQGLGILGDSSGSHGASRTRSVAAQASLTAARMQQLVAFYNWRDPAKAAGVPALFENHDFVSIAKGLYMRYPDGIPRQWRDELIEMQSRGIEGLEWFDPAPVTVGANGRAPPPAPPRIRSGDPNRDRVDQIIDEIIDTEHAYHGLLVETLAYGKYIRMISLGKQGVDAQSRLGLSTSDVDTVFGMRLQAIVDLSERFLANLEVIDLVRTEPLDDLGRPGLLVDAISSIIDDLHVYAPYVSMHRAGDRIVKRALARISRRPTAAKRLIGSTESSRFRGSFAEIWEKSSVSSARLCGQSLESALITPVQRVPRYMLLTAELARRLPATHPAYTRVQEVARSVADLAEQLNHAMRQHEKISALLGDEKLEPHGSSRRNLFRSGSSKELIKMVYPSESLERDRSSR